MTRSLLFLLLFSTTAFAQNFTLDAVKSFPFPSDLVRSKKGDKLAWVINEKGVRNVYVAQAPDFEARKVTNYTLDDGQEITSVSISDSGNWVVFVRGGDHSAEVDELRPVNPSGALVPQNVKIWQVPFAGGLVSTVYEGDEPVISPAKDDAVLIRDGQPWLAELDTTSTDGFLKEPIRLFKTRGSVTKLQWSPDGEKIAFEVKRDERSFIGVLTLGTDQIKWIDPSFAKDTNPKWSPNGKQLAFIRSNALGGSIDSLTSKKKSFWSIQVFDMEADSAKTLWSAPKTSKGSLIYPGGEVKLFWPKDQILNFLSYHDGWPHLYAINTTAAGTTTSTTPTLLTPGNFAVEHASLSVDGSYFLFDGNMGTEAVDKDHRHLGKVSIDKADMQSLSIGSGNEWGAVSLNTDGDIAYIKSSFKKLPQVVISPKTGNQKSLTENLVTTGFPEDLLIEPKQVTIKSLDGLQISGQLYDNGNGSGKKPAIVYLHGGPTQQNLLGWHDLNYYSDMYAMNQFLANSGFVVLSINYRSGTGYGHEFQFPKLSGNLGAYEYLDVKAAGEWLSKQSFVDAKKIGLYGEAYGGYLTALGLARDSKLFAAGVDIHGMHDWTNDIQVEKQNRAPDGEWATDLSYLSSPISSVSTWKSPTLFIHADDDRDIPYYQSVDIINRLLKRKVPVETMVIVDDSHHWLKYSNSLKVMNATANFFKAKLMKK
jgi:dipeptidyl aminopeptidase/acylaminoacyl peptidase